MQIDTLLDGLVFPEGPRWRDGTLWFSDIWDDRVARVSTEGECTTVTRMEQPSRPRLASRRSPARRGDGARAS